MVASLVVKKVLEAEGISLEMLRQMVQKSAIVTHRDGDRRFEAWVFRLSGNVVVTMKKSAKECK